MGKTLLVRLAAAAAGGALALAAAPAASAHDEPAPGFNAVLHGPHHDRVATDEGWPECDTVAEDAGAEADDLIKDGFDVWVFNIPAGQFDTSDGVTTLQVTFLNLADDEVTVTVPGGDFASWIGPAANPHLVAVSVPAGWTLLDGDFSVTGSEQAVRVTHTCPGEPGEPDDENGDNGEEEEEEPDNGKEPEGEQPEGEEPEDGLPVTGSQVGRMLALGAGLLVVGAGLAVGGVMLTARRRRRLTELVDG